MPTDYAELARHFGHEFTLAIYGEDQNASLECTTCYEVIISYDNEGDN